MVKVITTERKSAVLTPSSLACLSRIPTVNLTMGCAHGCLYCYTRGYSAYPGEGTVNVYSNSLELLRAELRRKRKKPDSIYFSTASDLFQPVPEALDLAYGILQEVFKHDIGLSFLTKGVIPERHMALLRENADLVRAQIGLITLDKALLRIFEPFAASPEVRMAQMKQLTDSGIKTQLRIDPILPALTDDDRTFRELCSSAADAGVTTAAASMLFLRPAVVKRLRQVTEARSAVGKCLSQFRNHQKITIHAKQSSVTALPVQHRERIFQRLENIASCYRMTVKRCACKNPDIAGRTCSIAGEWRRKHAGTQTTLFD
jgi:DNA repair photolyase